MVYKRKVKKGMRVEVQRGYSRGSYFENYYNPKTHKIIGRKTFKKKPKSW